MRKTALFLVLFFFFSTNMALGEPLSEVSVDLFQAHRPVSSCVVDGDFKIVRPNINYAHRNYFVRANRGRIELLVNKEDIIGSSQHVVLQAEGTMGLGVKYSANLHRHYKGLIDISLDKNGNLHFKNRVPLKDYVLSVVGSEMLPRISMEALKAQSVLTQTWLLHQTSRNNLDDTTSGQAYLGNDCITIPVRDAVSQTWGEKLYYKNNPVIIYFHSTCGGGTSDGTLLLKPGEKSQPYLKHVECRHCQESPFWKEKVSFIPGKVFAKYFESVPKIISADEAGRPTTVTFENGDSLTGYQFWLALGKNLGWDKMPGTRYKVDISSDVITLKSNGAGHGVGLCQWGAGKLAREGKTYKEILSYYFPGTHIISPVIPRKQH